MAFPYGVNSNDPQPCRYQPAAGQSDPVKGEPAEGLAEGGDGGGDGGGGGAAAGGRAAAKN